MNSLAEKLKKIHVLCIKHNLAVATAESCTGGYISKLITDLSNSSKYYKGSIIAYSNEVKSSILNISPELIDKYGAVSEEVSVSMAEGLLNIMDIDIALSVTGVMETNNDSSNKVTQVFITIKSSTKEITSHFILDSTRDSNRQRTVYFAFNCLYDFIHKNYLLS